MPLSIMILPERHEVIIVYDASIYPASVSVVNFEQVNVGWVLVAFNSVFTSLELCLFSQQIEIINIQYHKRFQLAK